jgi:hypothetical protein
LPGLPVLIRMKPCGAALKFRELSQDNVP